MEEETTPMAHAYPSKNDEGIELFTQERKQESPHYTVWIEGSAPTATWASSGKVVRIHIAWNKK